MMDKGEDQADPKPRRRVTAFTRKPLAKPAYRPLFGPVGGSQSAAALRSAMER